MPVLVPVLMVGGSSAAAAVLCRRFDTGAHRWIAALVAAAVAVWAALLVPVLALPGFALVAVAWGVATAVDLSRHQLPDTLTLGSYPAFLVLLVPWAVVHGGWGELGRAALAGIVTALVLFVLAYINPSGFGLGDVKLGLSTGAALGFLSWGAALLGILLAFILMAVISLVLLALRRIKRDSELAFGPFMVLGVLVAPWAATLLGW